jgi:hypothetical protein
MELEAQNFRLASYRIHQSLVAKPVPIEEYWPLKGDKKKPTEKIVMTRDIYAQIKKAHNL